MKSWQDYELPDQSLFPGQYRLLELLSESSASTVFLGFDTKEDANVIIKSFKNLAKSSFLREISAVYDMRHPHMVRCLNTFHRKDGESCLVYEYMPDGTLADLLESKTYIDIDFIWRCLGDLLKALIYMHAQSRIHCDIKPANIFLRAGSNGIYDFVLGDLGAACFLKEAQEGNHVVGTPAYIAPERIRNQFFYNSDLYSLGVVAFELCTGCRPFRGTVEEITQANLTEIPSLAAIEYPPLRDWIDHLLVKSPQKRIQTASLAYSHLIKLQAQYAKTIAPTKGASAVFGGFESVMRDKVQWVDEFAVALLPEHPILALQCLEQKGNLLIGVSYPGYTDFIDPRRPDEIVTTLIHTNFIQVIGVGDIAYSTPTRIQRYDLNSGITTTLLEKTQYPKDFYYKNNRLVVSDDFNVYYTDLHNQSGFSYRSANYLFNPVVGISDNGCLYSSEGRMNEKLVKRDSSGTLIAEYNMNGPITVMTDTVDEAVMGVSLGVNDQNYYSVWCLQENRTISQKLLLTEQIKQISGRDERLYWLTQEGELVVCNRAFECRVIKKCPSSTATFAVSKDESYFCTLAYERQNQAVIRIFAKEG